MKEVWDMETLKEIKSKIEMNKADKKHRLLDNAFQLFGAKGFAKTSISDIVNKAGVAKGTFYLYFKNKEDIRDQLVNEKSLELFSNAITDLEKKVLPRFEDRLIFVINHMIDDLNAHPEILTFIDKDLSLGFYSSELSKFFSDEPPGLYALFKEGVESEHLPIENIEITFFTILDLVGSTCYRCMVQKFPTDIETYKPFLFKSIRAILHIG